MNPSAVWKSMHTKCSFTCQLFARGQDGSCGDEELIKGEVIYFSEAFSGQKVLSVACFAVASFRFCNYVGSVLLHVFAGPPSWRGQWFFPGRCWPQCSVGRVFCSREFRLCNYLGFGLLDVFCGHPCWRGQWFFPGSCWLQGSVSQVFAFASFGFYRVVLLFT